jgi:TfoX/Sxy family transcriptional regulator of competence genes
MVYDKSLAARIRKVLSRRKNISEKKMFGGIAFLLNGNICVGVWKEFLIVRVGPDQYEEALAEPCVKEFDMTGRAMKGWIMVDAEGTEPDQEIRWWVKSAVKFVRTLPPK